MKKKSFFKQSLPELLLSVVVFVIGSTLIQTQFVNPYVDAKFNEYQLLSFYDETDFDFIVYKPSFSQIDELKQRSDVNDVIPFYQFITQINSRTSFNRFLAFDPQSDLELTYFNSNRLLFEVNELPASYAIVDETLLASLGGDISTTISFVVGGQTLQFPIGKVYERNPLFSVSGSGYENGVFSIVYAPPFKDLLENVLDYISYEGAFIKTNNYDNFLSYLTDDDIEDRYKPYGLVEPEENYANEDSYRAALYEVENFDYRQNNYYKAIERENWINAATIEGDAAIELRTRFLITSIVLSIVYALSLVAIYSFYNYPHLINKQNASIVRLSIVGLSCIVVNTIAFIVLTNIFTTNRINQYTFFSKNITVSLNSIVPLGLFLLVALLIVSVYFFIISQRSKIKSKTNLTQLSPNTVLKGDGNSEVAVTTNVSSVSPDVTNLNDGKTELLVNTNDSNVSSNVKKDDDNVNTSISIDNKNTFSKVEHKISNTKKKVKTKRS
jgi:hypothetical protein